MILHSVMRLIEAEDRLGIITLRCMSLPIAGAFAAGGSAVLDVEIDRRSSSS
jgi:hypothetical protein